MAGHIWILLYSISSTKYGCWLYLKCYVVLLIDRIFPRGTFYFDFGVFISRHKDNTTIPNADSLLKHQRLLIRLPYDGLPPFANNVWFKTKYAQELKALNITSDYSTFKNIAYYDLLKNYIKLSKQVEDQIDQFSNKFFVSDVMIGLQVRTGKMPDRNEGASEFYKMDHSTSINEALRIHDELLSLNTTSKMYISIFVFQSIIDFW